MGAGTTTLAFLLIDLRNRDEGDIPVPWRVLGLVPGFPVAVAVVVTVGGRTPPLEVLVDAVGVDSTLIGVTATVAGTETGTGTGAGCSRFNI